MKNDKTENSVASHGSATLAREVYAGHGFDRAMGYKFRCRIESRTTKKWFGLGDEVKQYRYVLEQYHMSWKDEEWGGWCSLPKAHEQAIKLLGEIDWSPTQEPIEKCFYVN
jgi:hypothetical protein